MRDAIGDGARHPGRGEIHFGNERGELRIRDDALKKGGVLAAALRFASKKEIVLADGGGAERVGFNDVGTGLEVLAVNRLDHFRLGELEQFEIAFQVLRRMSGKASAAVLLFG